MSRKTFQTVIFLEQFFMKGWEIGILILLPILLLLNKINLLELGILSTVLSISQFSFSLVSGYILQKIGTKNILVICAVLGTMSWMLLAFSPGIFSMVFIYLLAGASTGLSETCGITIISKSLVSGNRSEGIANFAMVGDAGRIFFTSTTTLLVNIIGINLFSVINVVLGTTLLISVLIFANNIEANTETEFDKLKSSYIPKYFKNHELVLSFLVGWLDSFSSASLFIFLPLLFASKGMPFQESGFLSILLFVGYMIGRKVLGKLADKIGTINTLMMGETFMALVILLIIFVNNFFVLVFLLLLLGISVRGTSPVCKALVADSIPNHLTIENGISVYISGCRVAGIASRPIFSSVIGLWGISFVFVISAVSALLINVPLKLKRHTTVSL